MSGGGVSERQGERETRRGGKGRVERVGVVSHDPLEGGAACLCSPARARGRKAPPKRKRERSEDGTAALTRTL